MNRNLEFRWMTTELNKVYKVVHDDDSAYSERNVDVKAKSM